MCLLWFLHKKDVAFILISFAVLKWDECLSVQLPFELPFQKTVQLLLELAPNYLECRWNDSIFKVLLFQRAKPKKKMLIQDHTTGIEFFFKQHTIISWDFNSRCLLVYPVWRMHLYVCIMFINSKNQTWV